jgi:hypothetical protein
MQQARIHSLNELLLQNPYQQKNYKATNKHLPFALPGEREVSEKEEASRLSHFIDQINLGKSTQRSKFIDPVPDAQVSPFATMTLQEVPESEYSLVPYSPPADNDKEPDLLPLMPPLDTLAKQSFLPRMVSKYLNQKHSMDMPRQNPLTDRSNRSERASIG